MATNGIKIVIERKLELVEWKKYFRNVITPDLFIRNSKFQLDEIRTLKIPTV
jgi:hypothetical protein